MPDNDVFVRRVSDLMGEVGYAHYFIPETAAVARAHGIDAFRFYFLGRGGVLGDVEPAVIGSAFGYFPPAVVERIWTTARERADVGPREAGRLHLQCSADVGRRNFADIPSLDAFCAAAEKVVAAADPAGLALFAGAAAEALPADLPGRAMQLTTVLREYRGSAHLVAVLAVGLEPKIAHGVRRPAFWETFGYGGEPLPEPTAEVRRLLDESDVLTDRLVGRAYGVLDTAEQQVMLDALIAMKARVPAQAGG